MGEDEAKTKFCCGPSVAGVYRDELNPYTRFCAGSACMAWRHDSRNFNPPVGILKASGCENIDPPIAMERYEAMRLMAIANGYRPHPDSDSVYGCALVWQKPQTEPQGYCGLASKP